MSARCEGSGQMGGKSRGAQGVRFRSGRRCSINGLLTVLACLGLSASPSESSNRWARILDGGADEQMFSVEPLGDGGFMLAGETRSSGAVATDVWVAKLDSSGHIQWQKTYGGSADDQAVAVRQTSDGGWIVAGQTYSFGAGANDVYVLKLDSGGGVSWQKTYGGAAPDSAASIEQTSDAGYIVAGTTRSFGAGSADFWLLKLDSSGNISWQRTYGGGSGEYCNSVQQTRDGGYIAAGSTQSFGAGLFDAWFLKVSSTGAVLWERRCGGISSDDALSVRQTSDGGYVAGGLSKSFGAGATDAWLVKLDGVGNVSWQQVYGGGSYDTCRSVRETGDGGYVLAGSTNSFGASLFDAWMLKVDSAGSVSWQRTFGGAGDDFFYSVGTAAWGGYAVAGVSRSFGTSLTDDAFVLQVGASGEIDPTCSALSSNSPGSTLSPAAVAAVTACIATASAVGGVDSGGTTAPAGAVSTVLCAAPEMPDLTGVFTTVTKRGSTIRARMNCENLGSAPAGSFTVKIYLSKTTNISPRSILIKTQAVPSLATGERVLIGARGTRSGRQKVIVAVIDTDSTVTESDEMNNSASRQLP